VSLIVVAVSGFHQAISLYVGNGNRGRGVGKSLIHRQVTAADGAGLWTLQTAMFPENRASIALHQSAGFRTLDVRERIGNTTASGATPSSSNGAAPTD
jgi:L-amino acid N-acyltransferase YncA